MLRVFFVLLMLQLCKPGISQSKPGVRNNSPAYQQKDTSVWTFNLNAFRSALYQGEKEKLKIYVELPMPGDDHEIWALASPEEEYRHPDIRKKTFTEKDFDKYYHNLFSKPFIKCFLRIKMQELYLHGHSESPVYKEDATSYLLRANFDKASSMLELGLYSETFVKISDKEWEKSEFGIIYRFKVTATGHVKWVRVFLAG